MEYRVVNVKKGSVFVNAVSSVCVDIVNIGGSLLETLSELAEKHNDVVLVDPKPIQQNARKGFNYGHPCPDNEEGRKKLLSMGLEDGQYILAFDEEYFSCGMAAGTNYYWTYLNKVSNEPFCGFYLRDRYEQDYLFEEKPQMRFKIGEIPGFDATELLGGVSVLVDGVPSTLLDILPEMNLMSRSTGKHCHFPAYGIEAFDPKIGLEITPHRRGAVVFAVIDADCSERYDIDRYSF